MTVSMAMLFVTALLIGFVSGRYLTRRIIVYLPYEMAKRENKIQTYQLGQYYNYESEN